MSIHKSWNPATQRIFPAFSTSTRNRTLSKLSRLSSTSSFRICAFVSLFLIISSTSLLFTALTTESKLLSLFPLPHKLRNSWSVKSENDVEVGAGPLIPRRSDSTESIYVLSLPHRTDRRTRMESLRTYLGLNWTYIDATYADEEIVKRIMCNILKLREEAMRARSELQRIRDAKTGEKAKEDGSGHSQVTTYPDDLEVHSTSSFHLPSTTSIPHSHQPSQVFSGVKLPFRWPPSPFTNESTFLESSLETSSIPLPSLKDRVLEFLETFDIYANNSDNAQRTWSTENDTSIFPDDSDNLQYLPRFLTNFDVNSTAQNNSNTLGGSSSLKLELVCATKDFSLSPYSSNLRYHKYLTSARVAVWHSHLRVLRQIIEESSMQTERERIQESGKENTMAILENLREEEDFSWLETRAMTRMRRMQQSRDKYYEHISVILEDDIDMEKDIRRRLRRIWDVLPNDWDIVFLGHCWSNESFWRAVTLPIPQAPSNAFDSFEAEPTSVEGFWNTLHPSYSPRCTHAYALSSPGARKLLAHLEYPPFAYSRAIDQAYAWLVLSGRLKAYSIVGSVVVQIKGGSVAHATGKGGQVDEDNVGVGDVWRPGSWRKEENSGSKVSSEAARDQDREVSTSSWTEELFDGVFSSKSSSASSELSI